MNKPAIAAIIVVSSLVIGGPGRTVRAQFFDGMGSGNSGPTPNIEGFTVAGKGQVAVKPDLAEIEMDVSAASELTADAIVKYRDAKRRIRDAFSALKLGNVTVDERGLLVDQKSQMQSPYYFDMQQNTRTKTEVQLTRKLIVRASDIRKMDEESVLQLVARLLDVAQDSGAKIGPQNNMNPYFYYRFNQGQTTGLVRFVIEDFDKIQDQAYELAIADARRRAERLARLSKVELGPIVAVRELVVPGEKAGTGTGGGDEEPLKKRLETAKFQEIPVKVELLVRFEVHSGPGAKGKNP